MAIRNLSDWLHILRKENDLVEINHPVNPHLEIPEIHRRVIGAGGPALLFKHPIGYDFPVVTNLFGTKKRVDLAFGGKPESFIKDVVHTLQRPLEVDFGFLWKKKHLLSQVLGLGSKFVSQSKAPVFECEMFDAQRLPALTGWPEDGGPFLTLPLVHTKSLVTHQDNVGMYRVQIFEPDTVGMHFQIHKGGGFHLHEAEQIHRPLPVNIYLGGPPAFILSAIAPLPEHVPEILLASLIQGGKLAFSRMKDHGVPVLAEAEFCLVGEVPPHVRRPEGPFGDHYGYYSLKHDFPCMKVKKILHKKNPIYPATVVGKPRQEDYFIGNYLQELLSPLFPLVMPGVLDLWSYGETGFHALSVAVLKERYGKESMGSVFRILGEGQLSLTKFLIAIDKPMDLKNFKTVLTYVLERISWESDLRIFSNLSMDTLDYTGGALNKGSKGVMIGMGTPKRSLKEAWSGLVPHYVTHVKAFCPGCLVIEIAPQTESVVIGEVIASDLAFAEWPLLILVDHMARATRNESTFLWSCFTRFDPEKDIHAKRMFLRGKQVCFEGPVCIDARMKPFYPKELHCDGDTRALVEKHWHTYFEGYTVDMGPGDEEGVVP